MRLFTLLALLSTATWAHAADVDVLVLDRDGKPLAEAVVVLDSTVSGVRPTPPAQLLIAQEKFKFVPAVSVAHLSTVVKFENLDRADHHVRGGAVGPGLVYLDETKSFSMRLSGRVGKKKADSETRTFSQLGPQMLGCHIHASMQGFVYVTDSPWAAVADADGKVRLTGAPSGPAKLRVWHADGLLEIPQQAITVADGMATVRVSTSVSPRKPRKAAEETKSTYSY